MSANPLGEIDKFYEELAPSDADLRRQYLAHLPGKYVEEMSGHLVGTARKGIVAGAIVTGSLTAHGAINAAPASAGISEDGSHYIVEDNDTASEIAARVDISLANLKAIPGNEDLAENDDLIFPGQRINLTEEAQISTIDTTVSLTNLAWHMASNLVAENPGLGDPNQISREILAYNGITADKQMPGMELRLPPHLLNNQTLRVDNTVRNDNLAWHMAESIVEQRPEFVDPKKVSERILEHNGVTENGQYNGMVLEIPPEYTQQSPVNQEQAEATIVSETPVEENVVDPAPAPVVEAPVEQPAEVVEVAPPQRLTEVQREWNIPISPNGDFKSEAEVDAFIQKVEAISVELGIEPDWLMAVMAFETGGSFSTDVRNGAGSGATGLIQFMPETAEGMGTTTEELARMSPLEQLDWVRAYFISSKGQMHSVEDVYMKVFFPAAMGKGPEHPMPNWVYRQNSGFDQNNDGVINVGEISTMVTDRYESAPPTQEVIEELNELHEAEQERLAQEEAARLEAERIEQERVAAEAAAQPQYHELVRMDTLRAESNGIYTVEIGEGRNIRVNAEHANQWAGLLERADAAGFHLTAASSFRSPEDQFRLRQQNCPDPVLSRPGECSPETGWVGNEPGSNGRTSQHIHGEAVDFRANGDRLTSMNHTAVQWLLQNAPDYGIHLTVGANEPWHWGIG